MKAILTSGDLDYRQGGGSVKCVSFNYFMNMTGTAEIRINAVYPPASDCPVGSKILWQHNGHVTAEKELGTNGWRAARIPFDADCNEFQVSPSGGFLRKAILMLPLWQKTQSSQYEGRSRLPDTPSVFHIVKETGHSAHV